MKVVVAGGTGFLGRALSQSLAADGHDVCLLSRGAGLTAADIAAVFEEWNQGDLRSYLVEITSAVLRYVDPETGRPLVDQILDEAQQKGTGKWTSQNAFDVGAPTASNLNFAAGQTVPNLVKVKVGADGKIKIANSIGNASAGGVQILVDIVGFIVVSTL